MLPICAVAVEDVGIPTNHFADITHIGWERDTFISLVRRYWGNSDFYRAFPAEYGNAVSGVFDIGA